MSVKELSREQLTELKQNLLCERMYAYGDEPAYAELAFVDDLISDEEIFAEYSGVHFVPGDFFCPA